MKSAVFLAIALLLTAGLATAQEPNAEIAQLDDAVLAINNAVQDDLAVEGGGCELPDFTGMSEEEIKIAALEAGFELSRTPAAAAMCPTTFNCSSLGSTCAPSTTTCTRANLGQCCTSGGIGMCCITGTIKVSYCPCQCTGSPCNVACPQNTEVHWGCF